VVKRQSQLVKGQNLPCYQHNATIVQAFAAEMVVSVIYCDGGNTTVSFTACCSIKRANDEA